MKNPSVPPPGPKARATYESLLAAGERLLGAGGFGPLTSTAVASEAGVATGTFYTYFAGKDALLLALFARRLDELTASVEDELTTDRLLDTGLEDTLRRVVAMVLSGYRRHAAVLRTALARVPDDAELRDVYWARHARTTTFVERFLRRGGRAGLVRPDAGPAVAQALLLLVQGLNHPVMVADPHGQAAEEICAEIVEVLRHLLAPRD